MSDEFIYKRKQMTQFAANISTMPTFIIIKQRQIN